MKATEKKILIAATKLFSEFGYASVSTKRISEQAGVSELTLFRTFKSKSNLLQAVIRHFAYEGNIVEKVSQDITGDIKKDIRIFTDTYYLFLEHNIKMYLIQVREIDEEGLRFTNSIDYTNYMKDYFTKKAELGEFLGDPNMVATSIVSMMMGIFTFVVHANVIYENVNYHSLIDAFVDDLITLYVPK